MRCSNRRCSALGLFLLAPLLAAGEPVADRLEKPSPGSWTDQVFRWFYNPQHQPRWQGVDAAREMVVEAAKQWQACGVRMEYQGDTDRVPGTMDRVNVVGWRLDLPRKIRGITLGQARRGRLLERDIAFRPDRKEFERFPHLLRKVIAHEFGHAVGLTHSSRCDDLMTLAADCPRVHPDSLPVTLTDNDLARCRALYGPVDHD